LVQGHGGLAPEKEDTMNTSTRKKILTVAGVLAVAGALVVGVTTNAQDKKKSNAVEQIAEFEALLDDGVINEGTLQSFLNDIVDENSPITNAIKDVMTKAPAGSEPKLDAKVTIADDVTPPTNKKSESAPVESQASAPTATEVVAQPAVPVSEQAGAATAPEAAQSSQPAPASEPTAQQPAAGGTTSTMPQWLIDMAKSTNVNILDIYKSWQSNGGTFSGITNPTLPTQTSVPSYTEICKRLGTC
jgi:FtsZ-interacting cell division protein ZipA